jgi:hypothetical protein
VVALHNQGGDFYSGFWDFFIYKKTRRVSSSYKPILGWFLSQRLCFLSKEVKFLRLNGQEVKSIINQGDVIRGQRRVFTKEFKE